jgi:uncharacterized RDD family membrane protein YckC
MRITAHSGKSPGDKRKTIGKAGTMNGFAGAPFALRCGALFIDYLLVLIFPVGFLLIGRISGNDGSGLIKSQFNDIGWILGILVGIVNFFVLPSVTGQSFGKILTALRIVANDGTRPSFVRIIIRQTLSIVTGLLTFGVVFIIAAFGKRGRAMHDMIAGTQVIYAQQVIDR